jgi:hypothetical protein
MVFWVMIPYSLVGDHQHFGGIYHLHHLISSSEILVTTKTYYVRNCTDGPQYWVNLSKRMLDKILYEVNKSNVPQ